MEIEEQEFKAENKVQRKQNLLNLEKMFEDSNASESDANGDKEEEFEGFRVQVHSEFIAKVKEIFIFYKKLVIDEFDYRV